MHEKIINIYFFILFFRFLRKVARRKFQRMAYRNTQQTQYINIAIVLVLL